jgi:hypothetical protein
MASAEGVSRRGQNGKQLDDTQKRGGRTQRVRLPFAFLRLCERPFLLFLLSAYRFLKHE